METTMPPDTGRPFAPLYGLPTGFIRSRFTGRPKWTFGSFGRPSPCASLRDKVDSTTFRGERFKVAPVTPAEGDLPPGRIAVEKRRVLVGTGAGTVVLGTVQAAGKKAMAALDWARGVRPEPEEDFA